MVDAITYVNCFVVNVWGLFMIFTVMRYYVDQSCVIVDTRPACITTVKLLYDTDLNYHNIMIYHLQWRHNGRDSVSNHQPHDCLLNRLFRRRSKKTSKPRITGLCAGNSPVPGEFPTQMASNAENISIWWHHVVCPNDRIQSRFWSQKDTLSLVLTGKLWGVLCEYFREK